MEWLAWTPLARAAVIATILFGSSAAASQSLSLDSTRQPIIDAGVRSSLGARIIAAEGGPEQSSLSSAAGYGQFLSSTWLEIFQSAYPQLVQIMSREQILALREVKPLAEDLTNRYAQANAATLRRVGLPTTDMALSLAHAVGPGGAIGVLASAPARPVTALLSPEAIAANPFFKNLTASTLQQWATSRVRVPVDPQVEPVAPKVEPALEPLTPAEDFDIDNRTKASQILAANQNATALLRDVIDATSKTDGGKNTQLGPATASWLTSVGIDPAGLLLAHPTALQVFNRTASQLVLDTIRSIASRPGYGEFAAFEKNAGGRGELRPAVVRQVAIALVDKMRRETATIADIVEHRRNSSDGRRAIARNRAPRAFHAVSNGPGPNVPDPSR